MEYNTVPFKTLTDLIAAAKAGNRDFFEVLQIPKERIVEASFDELMKNTDDVLAGVNRVFVTFLVDFFSIPTYCLVKYHDNGDIKFVFYVTTKDIGIIEAVHRVLCESFGNGTWDPDKGHPFTRKDKIALLSIGFFESPKDDLLQIWFFDNTSWLLQYRTNPLQEFSLMVNLQVPKSKDFSIRRRGTILDVVEFNIHEILHGVELSKFEKQADGKIVFIDYVFPLRRLVLGAFDFVNIRIFGDRKIFSKDIQTMVTFYSKGALDYDKKVYVMEQLISLYGPDNLGRGELELYEREILESNKFYVGRSWHFNEQHGLYSNHLDNEKYSYLLDVNDMEDEQGFKINIIGYNNLIALFSTE